MLLGLTFYEYWYFLVYLQSFDTELKIVEFERSLQGVLFKSGLTMQVQRPVFINAVSNIHIL